MAIKSDPKKQRELVPEGSHAARLYSIIEIGHVDGEYMGNPKVYHQIRLTWELPDETREFENKDGTKEMKPLVIGAKYTVSMGSKSNLRPIVEGMIGVMSDAAAEAFEDYRSLLGKECLISVVHKTSQAGNKYAKIASTAKVPKGMKVGKQFNESVYLDYGDGWNQAVYEKLPQFIKDDMAESSEMKEKLGNTDEKWEPGPDDLPF